MRDKHTGGSHLEKKTKEPKAPKTPKKSRLTGQQKTLVVIAVILAVALACVLIMKSLFVQPDLGDGKPGSEGSEEIDWGDGVRPKADGARKSKDFYTILLLGRDTGGGGNTDTMLLASYDVTNQKASVMSIPRDTMVNVSWDVKKINSVYNMHGGGDKGIQALYKEVSQLVGFAPDYRVIVEWEAVGAIVDAIGGVWFDNPYPMDYHDPIQDLVIEQAPGERLLSGKDAMQVIRWRKNDKHSPHGYHGGIGDTGRMQLQQDFLKAVLQQLMQPSNVKNIGKIAKVFQENVETDLSFQNILWFGQQAVLGGLTPDSVEFMTMPFRGTSAYSRAYTKQLGKYTELSYVVPVADELLEIVNNKLSPFVEPFTLSDLDIMSVNSDGSLRSTTGHLEDPKAGQVPVRPQTPPPALEEEGGELLEPGEMIPVDPEVPADPNAPADPNVPGSPETPVDPEQGESEDPGISVDPTPQTPPETQPQEPSQPEPPAPQPTEPPAQPEPVAPTEPAAPAEPGFSIIEPGQAA